MSELSGGGVRQPSIVLVSGEYADRLREEFWRYSREYDLRTAGSCAQALTLTQRVVEEGGTVALFVADSRLPDEHMLAAFGQWRTLVPTARRRCNQVIPSIGWSEGAAGDRG